MNTDHGETLRAAFGMILTRSRTVRKWTAEALAIAAGLSGSDAVSEMERGEREPTLSEFFNISHALGEPPAILLIRLIVQWRTDPTGDTL